MLEIQEQFRSHIRTHCDKTGFNVPELLEDYLVGLLSSRLRETELIPEPSFGERYLQLQQLNRAHLFQEYADQCLFFVSLLPDYGKKRGLDINYYASLGIASYYNVGDAVRDDRFIQMGNWFYHLQKFLNSAIHPRARLELFDFIDKDKYL
jgi:hypothetical protein